MTTSVVDVEYKIRKEEIMFKELVVLLVFFIVFLLIMLKHGVDV